MRAGQLRHHITIESITRGTDAAGGPTTTTAAVRTIWARARKMRGTERVHAEQTVEGAAWAFHCRALDADDVTVGGHQLTYDGNTYNVLDVLDVDERGREIILTCSLV